MSKELEDLLKENVRLRAKKEGFSEEQRIKELKEANIRLRIEVGEQSAPTAQEVMEHKGVKILDRKDLKIG